MRGRRFQVVTGLLLAPAMMAGLALTAGPAHAQYPVSAGTREGSAVLTRSLVVTHTTRPRLRISRSSGTPGSSVTVSGTGFGVHQAVDLYFDTSDKVLASTNGKGAFAGLALRVPSSALPGTHYITAVQRHTARSAQAKFLVNTNWVQDGFSASHTFFNPHENVLSPSNVAALRLDWTRRIGGNSEAEIVPSPTVVNGVVYISGEPFNGSPAGLCAFNAVTGALLWLDADGPGTIGGAPAVANGTLYTNFGTDSVYAISTATGDVKWGFYTRATVEGSPSLANGNLYFGSGNVMVYAVSAATGNEVWAGNPGIGLTSSPTVTDGVVYFSSGDGYIWALNAVTSQYKWKFFTGGTISYSTVAVASGTVYVATSAGDVYALDAANGHDLWSVAAGAGIASPMAVANGVVYIDTSGPDGAVDALSAATGQQLWTFTTGDGSGLASPIVANGVVYVGSTDDNVYALSAASGTELWKYPTGSSVVASPAVVNGRLYIESNDSSIYAFSLSGSQQAETRPRPSSLQPNYRLREQ